MITPGIVYALTFAALAFLFLRRSTATRTPAGTALEALLAGALGAAVGTRFFHLVVSGKLLQLPPAAWFDPSEGTASWGAYLGAIVGLAAYAALTRSSPLPHLDVATSCAGLGDAIGRWACYFSGDDFGVVSSVPWAIRFSAGSLAHQAHVSRGLVDAAAPASLPVHPMQFYLMVNGLVVFLVTSAVWRRTRDRPGVTAAAFLLLYGSTRFWWEFFRDPGGAGLTVFPSTSQWMCMLLVAAGAASLWLLRGRAHRPPPPAVLSVPRRY